MGVEGFHNPIGAFRRKVDYNNETKQKNFIHRERRYSSMSRSIYLEDSKADGITAKLENGLLKIIVPKEQKTTNSIEIDVE